MSGGATGRFFEQARVALEKEDVEEKVEGKGAEVKECGQETPVLTHCKSDFEIV